MAVSWPDSSAQYLALRDAYTTMQTAPHQVDLREKFATAVVDVFLYHKWDLSTLLSEQELQKKKEELIQYMVKYIGEQIAEWHPLELQKFSDPVQVSEWVKTYMTSEMTRTYEENKTALDMKKSKFAEDTPARAITWGEHTQALDAQHAKIIELQAKLQESQMGTMIEPRWRRINLLIADLKIPGKGDRTTRHYRALQPLYAAYIKWKNTMSPEQKKEKLREMIGYCSSVFPDMTSIMYWFQKGNFQTILDMSKKRRDELENLIKQDESSGALSTYKHNRLLARKAVFNIYNEVLTELEKLLIADQRQKKEYRLAA